MKISVVISAYNEESKIEECLKSVEKIASEIVFIDNSSTDKTKTLATKYTSKIFTRENNLMLNVNKNFGFSKAEGDWILSLDADERLTEELIDEINNLDDKNFDGYYIPRKNIIFGKWIEHTGWYPDFQLRLFRNGKGRFAEKQVHEMLDLKGKTAELNNPMIHYNYETVTQFLNKMVNTYTISEANNLAEKGYKYSSIDIVKMPLSEFIKRFFAEKGYRDGMHGLVLSALQSFYHLVVFARLWEMNNYPDEKEPEKIIDEGKKIMKKEFGHWMVESMIDKTSSPLKKNILRIKRKITT